jgi:hypothetical protein
MSEITDPMEREARVALGATRELHAALQRMEGESGSDDAVYKQLRRLAVKANKSVVAMRRLARAEAQRAATHETLLREAFANEAIDQLGAAARTQERLRTAIERSNGDATMLERATSAQATVTAAINALCPHPWNGAPGAAVIVEMQAQSVGAHALSRRADG